MMAKYKHIAFVFCFTLMVPAAAQTALDDYIQKPDPHYAWEILSDDDDLFAATYVLKLTSQQWRSAAEVDRPVWEHELFIFVPNFLFCAFNSSPQTAVLFINGEDNPVSGEIDGEFEDSAHLVANSMCSVIAVLNQVPNQPLSFTDEVNRPRIEDAILAYSLDKYLQTGDPEWPVHLAMTKAAVRAMDAVEEFSVQEIDELDVEDFIVIGGSKRGWTAWLAAAVDARVKAIIPVSIDVLNLDEQFVHHWGAYGFYAQAISEYIEFDLPCRVHTPEGQALLEIIDPYFYRERYTMPKLLINSAGDQFFVSDSSRFYYSGLPAPKHLRYTPNTDHTQGETEDILDLFLAARSWIDDINDGNEPPQFSWTFEDDGSIRVQTVDEPERVKLWQAYNANARDFRLESIGPAWSSTTLNDQGGGVYTGFVAEPDQGFAAFFIELEYEEKAFLEGDQVFTSEVRVTPDVLPFAGTECPVFTAYTNLWWNPELSGQAVQIRQQDDIVGGAWYLYDETGAGIWTTFVGTLLGDSVSSPLYRFTGPALGALWDNAQVQSYIAGDVTVDFASGSYATLDYTLNGVPGRHKLVPFERLADNVFTGVWNDSSRTGQAVQLVHVPKDNVLGGAWYLYDFEGEELWLTFTGTLEGDVLNADLLRFTGPLLGEEWDEGDVAFTIVGSVRVELDAPDSVSFDYTLYDVSDSLELVPYIF